MTSSADSWGQPRPGQRAAVLGLGMSNSALTSYLVDMGVDVWVYDQQPPEHLGSRWTKVAQLVRDAAFGDEYLHRFSQHDQNVGFDWVFVTPGMRKDLTPIEQARSRGARISSELPLFMQQCPAVMVGITGSSGKTTTTSMVGDMLMAGLPQRVLVGGNIGTTLIDRLGEISARDLVVLEISSFQLELAQTSTDYGAILNISPNHLDVHGSMDDYVQAKSRLLSCQPDDSLAILNWDCERTRKLSSLTRGRLAYFSMQQTPQSWSSSRAELAGWLADNTLWVRHEGSARPLCCINEIPLRGLHNVANVLVAGMLSLEVGACVRGVREAIAGFSAVPHRLEEVTCRDGILFVNDSIATSPDRTSAALDSFDSALVLILGGYDKGIPFERLARKVAQKARSGQVAAVILTGATASDLEHHLLEAAAAMEGFSWVSSRTAADDAVLSVVFEFDSAVRRAADLARRGEVVLLSPACASFDQFDNFISRGLAFRDIVTGQANR